MPILGEEKALLWPMSINCVAKNYHSKIFEGNTCRNLLKHADLLENQEICKHVRGPIVVAPFISSFKVIDKIVKSCFSIKIVGSNVRDLVIDLKKALRALDNVSETLKVHVAVNHIEQGINFLENNDGLGLWSKQAGESVHREFKIYWSRYEIKNVKEVVYRTIKKSCC